MIRVILLAAVTSCAPAHAQDATADYGLPDEFTLEVVSEDHAFVEYWNADPPNSGYAPRELTNGDLTVGIRIDTSSGPEILTVTPPPGWEAIPPSLSVIDGAYGRIDLHRGNFIGM